jgi:ABC-2 type transport system ATP-binding protein
VARRAFWDLIRELAQGGTTVFVTTHYLDEAEYCRRIGLMVDGKLVALDTPAGLKRTWVPERVVVVRGRGLSAGVEALRDAPGVKAVAPFGATLHVRVARSGLDAAGVAAVFEQAGARDVAAEEVSPSLEDVFLAAVGDTQEGKAS